MKYLLYTFTILVALSGCSMSDSNTPTAEDISFVENIMKQMTIKEKIGQMTQVDRQFLNDISDISKYGIGLSLIHISEPTRPN